MLKNIIARLYWETDKISKGKTVSFLNPYSYLRIRKNNLCFQLNYIGIDGIILVKLFNLFLDNKIQRLSFDMTSLAPIVFNQCILEDKSIYFIGSTEEEIQGFIRVIRDAFPKLSIRGYRNGYFTDKEERNNSLEYLARLNPDVVVVGMGTPYQEQYLIELRETGWNGTGYTCGGFIHQTAKGINYYPDFYDKYNLRWLYRMIDEPKLIKRYLIQYPKAILLFLYDVARYKLT